MAECKHEMDRRWCSWCRKIPEPAEELAVLRARLVTRGWIIAKWPGKCAGCHGDFPAGAAIIRDDDVLETVTRDGDLRVYPTWRAECCATEQELSHAG